MRREELSSGSKVPEIIQRVQTKEIPTRNTGILFWNTERKA